MMINPSLPKLWKVNTFDGDFYVVSESLVEAITKVSEIDDSGIQAITRLEGAQILI